MEGKELSLTDTPTGIAQRKKMKKVNTHIFYSTDYQLYRMWRCVGALNSNELTGGVVCSLTNEKKVKMSLWVDKHRPNTLSKLILHPSITNKLVAIGNSDDLPHLLFYGPPGSGKKTRVMALLRELYGAGVERSKLEHRSFKTPSNKVIDLTTIGSNFHIECNPSDAGNNDKFVTQEVIKEIASHGTLQASNPQSKTFKVVVLIEVDKLTKQAQASLRRTMEK
jgi:replication factor C subunit 3/5